MVPHVQAVFERRGAPAMMLRLNWGTQYATQWGYHESRSVPMISAAQAVALGADIVLVGMSIKTGSEAVDAENVAQVAACVAEKRVAGVPIVGEVYPAGHEDIPPEERHEQIAIGCRIVAELGADLVKTFHTGERFAEIVRSTPVPILALGAKKTAREVDALELAAMAVRDGARGVVFGRNVAGAQPGAVPRGAPGGREAGRRARRGRREARPRVEREDPCASTIGLDVGTTSVKAGLLAEDGRMIAVAGEEYSLRHPAPDRAELDAETYWTAAVSAVRRALAAGDVEPADVAAIGVSSQGETVTPVDAAGAPVGPAQVWLDNRGLAEAREIEEAFGSAAIYDATGVPSVFPTWTACRILWLRRNEPATFAAARRFLLVEDLILHRLTGRFVSEGGVACTSLLFDIRSHDWWPAMLDAVGIGPERLPSSSRRAMSPGR